MSTHLTGATAKFTPWTDAELRMLRESYARGGIRAAQSALPHRSRTAIFHRADRLGLKRRRLWTAQDDARLRQLWASGERLADVAAELGRTQIATYWRAEKLGLKRGAPDGWEYLSESAERTGYSTGQLRRILAAHGGEIRSVLARPTERRGKKRGRRRTFHVVWPEEVDAAIASWLSTEPIATAARRLGVGAMVLERRLARIGLQRPKRGRAHWRVSAKDVARAMAGYEPPREVAPHCTHPDGCTEPHYARDLCRRHYYRRQYHVRNARVAASEGRSAA